MTAFTDYLDLRFAVSDHCGNRNLSDVMPRLVRMAEASLNKKLRCRQQITEATLTFTAGEAALPADFIEMINVFYSPGCPMRAGTLADVSREGSQYSRYAIDGTNIIIKGFSGTKDIQYFASLSTLTTSPSTSNWLLQSAPDVYLYAVSLEAAKFMRDAELGMATGALLDRALDELRSNDDRARWANATIRVRGTNP